MYAYIDMHICIYTYLKITVGKEGPFVQVSAALADQLLSLKCFRYSNSVEFDCFISFDLDIIALFNSIHQSQAPLSS
jgi:hypothetical protein